MRLRRRRRTAVALPQAKSAVRARTAVRAARAPSAGTRALPRPPLCLFVPFATTGITMR